MATRIAFANKVTKWKKVIMRYTMGSKTHGERMLEMLVREDDAAVKKKKKRIVQIWLVQAWKV